MSHASDALERKVEAAEDRASRYETATNFEAKKQEYLNELASIESTLGTLERVCSRMEFLASVLVDVLDKGQSVPDEVEEARVQVRNVLDYDADEYYHLVDQGQPREYERRVRQAKGTVESATGVLESELRTEEKEWQRKVDAGKNVQRLFRDSDGMRQTLREIETFVNRRMWDDSESITALASDWQGLRRSWERSGADWETFQAEYGVSDRTISILQELATGSEVELARLDEQTTGELLAIDELDDVVKLTI